MHHSNRLAVAAWSKTVVSAQGRAVLVFSSLARPLAALVITASDEQLANLVAHGTCITSRSPKHPLATA